ncbi:MAG: hypothetical protein FJ303_10405 [Planctomycetes bacterium]|nr:hypothetical protein [Planctomycetota bacterium]
MQAIQALIARWSAAMGLTYIIDGYNLIHALGMIQTVEESRGLEASRQRLLVFLRRIFADLRDAQVTIVFDAHSAPRGAPRRLLYHGLQIHFAPPRLTADDWIENLIQAANEPRKLIVISNDNRLQAAARHRGAQAWSHEALLDFAERHESAPADGSRASGDTRSAALSPAERQQWIDEFQSLEDDPELKEFFDMDRFDDDMPDVMNEPEA